MKRKDSLTPAFVLAGSIITAPTLPILSYRLLCPVSTNRWAAATPLSHPKKQ
ncbi:MAG: hypothetical protein U9R58_15885 [Chloroflexota bacterium]|nr:hypothetical protein [Chloroflexota bacterium]